MTDLFVEEMLEVICEDLAEISASSKGSSSFLVALDTKQGKMLDEATLLCT